VRNFEAKRFWRHDTNSHSVGSGRRYGKTAGIAMSRPSCIQYLASNIWMQRSWLASAHHESIELVAVEIAKVAGIEAAIAARPGRAFVGATERQRELVDAVDLRLVLCGERHHHAIADGLRLAVKRLGDAEAGAAAGRAPGNESLGFHEALDAHLHGDLVVERGGSFHILGAQSDVADHRCSSCLAMVSRAVSSPM